MDKMFAICSVVFTVSAIFLVWACFTDVVKRESAASKTFMWVMALAISVTLVSVSVTKVLDAFWPERNHYVCTQVLDYSHADRHPGYTNYPAPLDCHRA
jgi:hypothetical protein